MKTKYIFNALQTSLNGGIGRYSYELAKNLYKNNKDIKILIRKEDENLFSFAKDNLIIINGINNSLQRNIFEQFKLPKLLRKNYNDYIIHFPDCIIPILCKNKVVITVHDMAFKSVKGSFTKKSYLWKNFMAKIAVRKANQIICITNFARSELTKYFNVSEEKINTIYNGVTLFNEIINENYINDDIKLLKEKKYLLSVSTISPRKNIDGLIKAFNNIKNDDVILVICGSNGWLSDNVFDIVDKLNIKDKVIFTGKVNDEELKYLYKNCRGFVFPSFYEGFGLPPLEAMNFNVPVLASNKTSIPEVLGDSVIYFNPYNIKDITSKLNYVVNTNTKVNIEKYKKQLNKFSWDICAKKVIKVYDKLVN